MLQGNVTKQEGTTTESSAHFTNERSQFFQRDARCPMKEADSATNVCVEVYSLSGSLAVKLNGEGIRGVLSSGRTL